jgi:hypothetical protein
MKTLDIDKFLNEKAMTIVLKGKEFIVKDLDDTTRKLMDAEEPDHKAIVKSILKCEEIDLDGYGIVAFSNIISEVTKNLFPDASLNEASTD